MGLEIPIFPLGVVLFPHMPLSLHIFEERYRAMMRDCLAEGTSFGVVALRDRKDRLGSATPYPVGTLAQFRQVEPLPDGRYRLEVAGASRFRIDRLIRGRPYLRASIHYLEDTVGGEDLAVGELARRAEAACREYAASLGELSGETSEELPPAEDPELLSYLVAATLQVEVAVRQSLLELDGVGDRLRRELALLRREKAILGAMLARREETITAFSRN